LIEKIWIVEMGPSHQLDGVMPALAHTANGGNAHGKEQQRFDAAAAVGNAVGIEHASVFVIAVWEGFKLFVGAKVIGHAVFGVRGRRRDMVHLVLA
jgi:hypothetical protein